MQFVYVFCTSAENLNFNLPRKCSNMPKVRWVVSHVFCKKKISYAFQQCKNFENRLRFDKATVNYKVGTILRRSVQAFGTESNDFSRY